MAPLTLRLTTVLIFAADCGSAEALASRLRRVGANVHVVTTVEAAITTIKNRKIDVAFIGYDVRRHDLMQVLTENSVGHITCATPADMDGFAAEVRGVARLVTRRTIER